MPSNKTLFILIVCFGVVTSFYLFSRGKSPVKQVVGLETSPYIQINGENNNDWQKILVSAGLQNSTSTVLANNDLTLFDETTLTAQMSRDLFSKYLLVAKKEGGITTDDADQITGDVLSYTEYTKVTATKYTALDIKTTTSTDRRTVTEYYQEITKKLLTTFSPRFISFGVIFRALGAIISLSSRELESYISCGRMVEI